jgi:antitoxin VapB
MGLSIKNEEVEARIRRLTELTGEGVTEAIDAAVREKLARVEKVREEEIQRRMAAVDAILAKYGPFPKLDQKAIDEEMFDEFGVPR